MSLFMKMAQIENCQNPWMAEGYKNFADAIMWCPRLFYSMRTTFFLEGIANDFSQVADSVFVF